MPYVCWSAICFLSSLFVLSVFLSFSFLLIGSFCHRCPQPTSHNLRTFNETNHYQLTHIGPIDVDTILKLDAANGKVLNSWGASLFFFPHGMTIDHHGNIWVTDVALHQVFKFKPKSRYPSITIGRRFQPGSIPSQLCKPTAVAVATTGEVSTVFVSLTLSVCAHANVLRDLDFFLRSIYITNTL